MKNLIKLLLFTLFTVCLSSTAFAKVYDFTYYNQLSLIEDPHESVDIKIDLIKNAKHHVHIITYFWDNSEVPRRVAEELNKANERGVEVRIVTSFLPTFGTDPLGKGKGVLKHKNPTASLDYPNTFLSPVEDPNSAVFTYFSLTPGTKFSLTNSFHEKIFLVDGEVAIIGGRNISDSSLSGKDLEVMMRGAVVNQVQDHFYRMYYFILHSKMEANCARNNTIYVDCSNVFMRSNFNPAYKTYSGEQPRYTREGSDFGDFARIISHEALLHQRDLKLKRSQRVNQQDDILDTVLDTKFRNMRAYNYFILPTPKYKKYLEKNLKSLNSIQMITNSFESAKFSSNLGYIYSIPDALDLVEKGLDLFQWESKQKLNYVHAKALIFDTDRAIVGSHNFGVGSTTVSNEIVIEFRSKVVVSRLIKMFDAEKNNPEITKQVDAEYLNAENKKYKMQIKLLRKKIVSGMLGEIY